MFTDCNSIKSSRNKVELSPRIYRYWELLQTFEFEIECREGKQIAYLDFLSRNPVFLSNKSVPNKIEEKRIDLTEISENRILVEQQKDPQISEILTKLKNDDLPLVLVATYETKSNVLYRKIQRNSRSRCLLLEPRTFRWSVINQVYHASRLGENTGSCVRSLLVFGYDKICSKICGELHYMQSF